MILIERPIRLLMLSAALLCGACASRAAAGPSSSKERVDLEAMLAAPYVTAIVAAEQAEQIAWVAETAGVRNLYTADGPHFAPVQLTKYADDDGQVISSFVLTPDGRTAVFVRGGSANRAGEYPNPTSDPAGTKPSIWQVSTRGDKPPTLLAEEGLGVVMAPDGTSVLYGLRGQVYIASLRPQTEAGEAGEADSTPGPSKARRLFSARGRNGQVSFSPDAKRVVFVSGRGDHAFIGVYDLDTKQLRWMAPDVDRDYAPVWSPDGRSVAFFRRPGGKRGEVRNLTANWPFAVWIADVDSGRARQVWRSPGRDGGFSHYYPAGPLRWTPSGRLVFFSEQDGWMHVYSIDPADKDAKPVLLTPGAGEAESIAVSRDGKMIYVSGNFDDIDGRQLYRVPIAGGRPTRLTKGQGIETNPVVTNQALIWRSGSAQHPQGVALARLNGADRRAIFPNSNTALPLPTPKVVTFDASDGLTIHGQLFLPPNGRKKQHPGLIFMHGGPIRQMLPGFHYRGYYAKAYAMNQYLAGRGYVVLSVNFRAGIGYGRAFRQAANQGPRGAAEYKDILAAAAYLKTRPEIDPDRLGLWGGSYGGYLTALGLARDSQLFAAGVDLHGVHDWSFRATDFSPGGAWGLVGDAALSEAVKSSPVADLSYWSSPVLFIHGDDDRNVLFAQTTDLVQRLRTRGVTVETLVFPDEVHGFLRHKSWMRAYRATAAFFDRHLKR